MLLWSLLHVQATDIAVICKEVALNKYRVLLSSTWVWSYKMLEGVLDFSALQLPTSHNLQFNLISIQGKYISSGWSSPHVSLKIY